VCWVDCGWRWVRGNLGVVVPVTFRISYVIWWWVLSNQILLSVSRPSPLGLVMTIISPLSATCSLQFAACLYTSCLFVYSVCDNDILHLIVPLCLLIPSYNYRLDALEGHWRTRRSSPGGAFTRMQPVVRAKSFPKWADRASFHCSLSPL
jgi:hypothetical protein